MALRIRSSFARVLLVLVAPWTEASVGFGESRPAHAGESLTVQEIVRAWEATQSRIRSVRLSWIEWRSEVKGALSVPSAGTAVVPPTDRSYAVPSQLKLDGVQKMSYAMRDRSWFKGREVARQYISAYDGQTSVVFWPKSEAHYPDATIGQLKHNPDCASVCLLPFLMTLRPLEPTMGGCRADQLRLLPDEVILGDRRCRIVEHPVAPGSNKLVRLFWIDPLDECAIRRMVVKDRDVMLIQMDVSYSSTPDRRSVPQQWKLVVNSGKSSTVGKLVDCEINPTIPIEEFQVAFPAGTLVTDDAKGQWYIVKPDGTKHMIQSRDLKKGYDALLEERKPKAVHTD
jgi:hypothetical protein